MSEAFLDSAQRLLEADQASLSDLTVASLAILSISMVTFGNDDMARKYMAMCIRMGEDMHFYGDARYKLDQFYDLSASEASMLSYVAWGAFNISGYVCARRSPVHKLKTQGYTRSISTTWHLERSLSTRHCYPSPNRSFLSMRSFYWSKTNEKAYRFPHSATSGASLMMLQLSTTRPQAQSMNMYP